MVSAAPLPSAAPNSLGVGALKARAAANVDSPPNPNAGLNQFLVADPNGGATPVFDAAAWNSAAWNSAAWDSAAWNSAAWNSAAWNSAAWSSAAWNSAAWNSAAWNSGTLAQGAEPTSRAAGSLVK
jgi:hypothetical protein